MNAQLTTERCYCNLTLSELASLPLFQRTQAYEHILSHQRGTSHGMGQERSLNGSREEGTAQ